MNAPDAILDLLAATHAIGLARRPVAVEGKWLPAAPARWRGIARAEDPLVAVSLLQHDEGISWTKSERGVPEGQEIHLALPWFDREGVDVGVRFGTTNGVCSWRTRLPSAEYRPLVADRLTCETGRLFRFALFEGSSPIACWFMFLSARDVRVGRNGLWHLRKPLRPGVSEPLRTLLSYGRTGEIGRESETAAAESTSRHGSTGTE